jgi:hypothetical protein
MKFIKNSFKLSLIAMVATTAIGMASDSYAQTFGSCTGGPAPKPIVCHFGVDAEEINGVEYSVLGNGGGGLGLGVQACSQTCQQACEAQIAYDGSTQGGFYVCGKYHPFNGASFMGSILDPKNIAQFCGQMCNVKP